MKICTKIIELNLSDEDADDLKFWLGECDSIVVVEIENQD